MYLLYIVLKKRVEFLHSVVTVVCFNKTLQVPIMQNVDVCMYVPTYYIQTIGCHLPRSALTHTSIMTYEATHYASMLPFNCVAFAWGQNYLI